MHIPIFIQVFCNFGLSRHTSSLSKAFMPHWSHQGIGFTSMTLRSRFLPQTSATPDIHQKRLGQCEGNTSVEICCKNGHINFSLGRSFHAKFSGNRNKSLHLCRGATAAAPSCQDTKQKIVKQKNTTNKKLKLHQRRPQI